MKGTKGQTIKIIRSDDDADEFGFMVPEVFKDKGYIPGNGDMAFSGEICEDCVISVGAYNSCLKYINYQGRTIDYSTIPSHNLAQAGYGKIDAMAGVKKILGIDTSIPDLPRQQVQVRLEGHTLFLQEQEDVEVTVYSISGKQVMTTQAKDGVVQLNGLASGVYAVKVGQKGSTLIRL